MSAVLAANDGNEIMRTGLLLGGRKVLKQLPVTELEAHDLIQRGLPGQALNHLVDHLLVIKGSRSFEHAFGLSLRTYQRRKAEPAKQLDIDQSSRTWRFAKILAKATEIFGGQERAEQWLDSPAAALDRRKPIDLLTTHEGVGLVEALLTRLEYGVYT
jgi:putative toxin-antitoxin system antitoxin component (TIGR02293 family)